MLKYALYPLPYINKVCESKERLYFTNLIFLDVFHNAFFKVIYDNVFALSTSALASIVFNSWK